MKLGFKPINFKSIITRWFRSVFALTILVLVAIGVVLGAIVSTMLYENIKRSANDYAREFSALSSATNTFRTTAVKLCEDFSEKSKIEVSILDKNGNAFVSTSGFAPSVKEDDPAFKNAVKSRDGKFTQRIRTKNGEPVMVGVCVVKDKQNKTLGAYRWTVSLKATKSILNQTYVIMFAVLLLIFIFFAIIGIKFLQSIVIPIREVRTSARKIAMGDLQTRIEKKHDDEIGDLCDSVNYMASELQNADRLKNDFISSVSHELRTPLTAIRGWGETAKMSIGTDEELVARGIDVVLSEADRLSNLVEELLDFSRMQQGRLRVTTAPIDVSSLLCSVTDMYSELAKKQGIEIAYTPPIKNAIVMGDKDRLKQVFINIIDNAVKYTEKGGLILVTQTHEEGCIQIQVKDTGIGISSKDIDHVKEKFYKANQTVRGSGIGLAVADEIIKQHNGLLFIESTEGVGTTVTVAVPLLELPEEKPPEETIKEEPREQSEAAEKQDEAAEEPAEQTENITDEKRIVEAITDSGEGKEN